MSVFVTSDYPVKPRIYVYYSDRGGVGVVIPLHDDGLVYGYIIAALSLTTTTHY